MKLFESKISSSFKSSYEKGNTHYMPFFQHGVKTNSENQKVLSFANILQSNFHNHTFGITTARSTMISGFIQVSERKLPVILTLTGGIN
jgi:hypothetical protein